MEARAHTLRMLRWWHRIATVDSVELAVRRPDGEMIWHDELPIVRLPLRWLRAENARCADIYIRPARRAAWPLVFLDDVERRLASRIARKYDCAVIETSPPGGCHVWLRTRRALSEVQRGRAQRWLAQRAGADPASVSGEHLGRLAGMKNWKRHGAWVNVLALASERQGWDPEVVPDLDGTEPAPLPRRRHRRRSHRDHSPSGHDWAWVCSQLERGAEVEELVRRLVARSRPRRRDDAHRYAHRTVRRALDHVTTVNNQRT